MNAFQYALIAWLALSLVVSIATFHLPPPKKTAQGLAIGVLINVALIAVVVLSS